MVRAWRWPKRAKSFSPSSSRVAKCSRAEVGSRLNAIDQAADTRGAESVDLQSLLSDLRDVDYAEAVSRLNQEYTGLQAAQAAYTKISQLSLFDYL